MNHLSRLAGSAFAFRATPGQADDAITMLMEQMRAEYAEMPGLSVTLPQAQRLWGVDRVTCEEALGRLVTAGVLWRTTKGRFIRGVKPWKEM